MVISTNFPAGEESFDCQSLRIPSHALRQNPAKVSLIVRRRKTARLNNNVNVQFGKIVSGVSSTHLAACRQRIFEIVWVTLLHVEWCVIPVPTHHRGEYLQPQDQARGSISQPKNEHLISASRERGLPGTNVRRLIHGGSCSEQRPEVETFEFNNIRLSHNRARVLHTGK